MKKTTRIFVLALLLAMLTSAIIAIPVSAQAAQPTVSGTTVYANGTALLITEGSAKDRTTIYIDANRNGVLDSGELSLKAVGISSAPDDDSDLSSWTIYGGYENSSATVDVLMTMTGGNIRNLYGRGTDGNAVINFFGGKVNQEIIFGTSGQRTLNIKGNACVNSLYTETLTNGRVTIVGELTGNDNEITIMCGYTSLDTVLAETANGVDQSYADASKFRSGFLGQCKLEGDGAGKLYLKYNTYKITYDLKGGTGGTNAPTTATADSAFAVSPPSKANCTFLGWTVYNDYSYEVGACYGDASTSLTNSITYNSTRCINSNSAGDVWFKNLTTIDDNEIVLTAVWQGTITSVSINNTPIVGDTLTATTVPAFADVDYEWKVDETVVGTGSTYTMTDSDIGYPVSLTVTGKGGYTSPHIKRKQTLFLIRVFNPLTIVYCFQQGA